MAYMGARGIGHTPSNRQDRAPRSMVAFKPGQKSHALAKLRTRHLLCPLSAYRPFTGSFLFGGMMNSNHRVTPWRPAA